MDVSCVFPSLWLHDLFHLITCGFKTRPSSLSWLSLSPLCANSLLFIVDCCLHVWPLLLDEVFGLWSWSIWWFFFCTLCKSVVSLLQTVWNYVNNHMYRHVVSFIIFDWPGSASLLSMKLLLSIFWVQCHFALLIPQNKLIHVVLTGCFLFCCFVICSEGLHSRSFIENKLSNSSMVSD